LLGEDGDTPLPFQGVGIQISVCMIHPAQGAAGTTDVQKRLGEGGLTGIHMGQQADGAGIFPGASHAATSFRNIIISIIT
jgi:hypothetical protein